MLFFIVPRARLLHLRDDRSRKLVAREDRDLRVALIGGLCPAQLLQRRLDGEGLVLLEILVGVQRPLGARARGIVLSVLAPTDGAVGVLPRLALHDRLHERSLPAPFVLRLEPRERDRALARLMELKGVLSFLAETRGQVMSNM